MYNAIMHAKLIAAKAELAIGEFTSDVANRAHNLIHDVEQYFAELKAELETKADVAEADVKAKIDVAQ